MAITIKTPNPANLITSIENAIKLGTIKDWELSKSESGTIYFTHSAASEQNKAWFKVSPPSDTSSAGTLVFNIVRPKNEKINKIVYAIYHGRFAEMLLTHFDNQFTEMTLPALASPSDLV